MQDAQKILTLLSQIFGWIYFAAWSLSFYGQPIENYRRHKVTGLNFDYTVFNLFGYMGYTYYTIMGYINPNLNTGKITIQDIFFSAHALLLTIIQLFQIWHYYDKKDPNQKVALWVIIFLIILTCGGVALIICERVFKIYIPEQTNFNSLIYCGWAKALISLIKYMPQAYSNCKRKSTIGWNIHNMLLDFTGGFFSFAQNFVEYLKGKYPSSINDGEPKGLNIAKYALSYITMFFDIIFIFQHYVLYRNSNSDLNQKSPPLIQDEGIDEIFKNDSADSEGIFQNKEKL